MLRFRVMTALSRITTRKPRPAKGVKCLNIGALLPPQQQETATETRVPINAMVSAALTGLTPRRHRPALDVSKLAGQAHLSRPGWHRLCPCPPIHLDRLVRPAKPQVASSAAAPLPAGAPGHTLLVPADGMGAPDDSPEIAKEETLNTGADMISRQHEEVLHCKSAHNKLGAGQ
jgi:hypothetical protein